MLKKIILITISITILLGLVYFFIKTYWYYFPIRTGGVVTPASTEEIQEGQAINKLIQSVPLEEGTFIITEYDYSTGKFIVISKDKALDVSSQFYDWYTNSEYKSISLSRFIITE